MATSAKVSELDYIQFVLAAQSVYSCVEAARTDGAPDSPPAHDAYTRLLRRQPPDPEALWQETQAHVDKEHGLLVVDDSTLDKPHARHMALVHKHWSGKHNKSVWGINLVTLLWTDGGARLPIDCRLSNVVQDGVDKNQHFRAMLTTAGERGFTPDYVCFDSWYSSLDNLKAVRSHGWHFLCRFKSNRQVNPDHTGNVDISLLSTCCPIFIDRVAARKQYWTFVVGSVDRTSVWLPRTRGKSAPRTGADLPRVGMRMVPLSHQYVAETHGSKDTEIGHISWGEMIYLLLRQKY